MAGEVRTPRTVEWPRRVQLVVSSTRHTNGEIAERLSEFRGLEVRSGQIHPRATGVLESFWEVGVGGADHSDISELIEQLHALVNHVSAELKELSSEGCKIILQLILYLTPDDSWGAGFALSGPLVKWMSEIGIEVDVDQYIIE